MRLLLDTHALIWHREANSQLGTTAREMINHPDNQIFISIATLWEMSIKRSLGKLTTVKSPSEILDIYRRDGAELLSVTPDHVTAIESLPWHHRDPFDRMLIAQAKTDGLTLVTKDEAFARYEVAKAW
jgi:Uncharacterized protein conserved in bacteria